MSQPLPYDETEMWHDDPDLYFEMVRRNFEFS